MKNYDKETINETDTFKCVKCGKDVKTVFDSDGKHGKYGNYYFEGQNGMLVRMVFACPDCIDAVDRTHENYTTFTSRYPLWNHLTFANLHDSLSRYKMDERWFNYLAFVNGKVNKTIVFTYLSANAEQKDQQ